MAEFVVNIVLLVAVLVLLIAWAVNAGRRRRRDRREHAAQRRLILAAVAAAPGVPAGLSENGEPAVTDVVGSSSPAVPTAAGQFDDAAVAALLDLLVDRRPVRRGLFAGLVTSPRSVWSAGTRAGQSVGSRTVRDWHARVSGEPGSDLCRDAAAELVDIHGHDLADAYREYVRFEAAVGDPVLAELYVRRAAYATYADHDHVLRVVGDITGTTTYPPKLSDDAATIDT